MLSYIRCGCGTKVETDPSYYGEGYGGMIPNSCQPCWEAEDERMELQRRMAEVMGPGPAVFDGDF